jgi:hypothetical protein
VAPVTVVGLCGERDGKDGGGGDAGQCELHSGLLPVLSQLPRVFRAFAASHSAKALRPVIREQHLRQRDRELVDVDAAQEVFGPVPAAGRA